MLNRLLILLIFVSLLMPVSINAKSYIIIIEGGYSNIRGANGYPPPAKALSHIRNDLKKARLTLEEVNPNERPNPIDKYRSADFDLIIAVGIDVAETAYIASVRNKYQRYALVDVRHSNIKDNSMGFPFSYPEAGFLAGFMAAKTSKTGSVGFIGGQLIPHIKDFARGFSDGAKYANPDIKVKSTYIGTFFDTYAAENEADRMFRGDIDVVCHLAGPAGQGVLVSARNNDKWCINAETTESALPAQIQKETMQLMRDISDGIVPVRDYNSRVIN